MAMNTHDAFSGIICEYRYRLLTLVQDGHEPLPEEMGRLEQETIAKLLAVVINQLG